MKQFGTLVAAAGVALALSFSGAFAQQNPGATGTGSATQQDKPSTAGMSNPGGAPSNTAMGGMMRKKKMMHHHRKHHRMKKMKKMM